jgi:hypothetical protein
MSFASHSGQPPPMRSWRPASPGDLLAWCGDASNGGDRRSRASWGRYRGSLLVGTIDFPVAGWFHQPLRMVRRRLLADNKPRPSITGCGRTSRLSAMPGAWHRNQPSGIRDLCRTVGGRPGAIYLPCNCGVLMNRLLCPVFSSASWVWGGAVRHLQEYHHFEKGCVPRITTSLVCFSWADASRSLEQLTGVVAVEGSRVQGLCGRCPARPVAIPAEDFDAGRAQDVRDVPPSNSAGTGG